MNNFGSVASHSFGRRVNNVIFRNVTLNEVTQFATQGFRPYTANHDTRSVVDNAMNIIGERNFNLGRFSPDTIGSITDNMIGVSGAATGNIGIDNGWNSVRYMSVSRSMSRCRQVDLSTISSRGFTDTNNINVNGNHISVDPNIVLHITNIAEGRSTNGGLFIGRS